MTPGVLTGIRVLDITRGLSGPYATQVLGDLGAEIIKIEMPEGDEQRVDRGGSRPGETPAGFVAYNRNKRSIALDLKDPADHDVAWALAMKADLIVQNFRTGVMKRLGLDYETVSAQNPSVVYCSVSGFGSTGPLRHRAANDIVIQAMSGLMSMTGYPGMEPVRAGGYPADLSTGVWSALGMLAALYHRRNTGEGQHLEVAMMDSVLASLGRIYGGYLDNGTVPKPLGSGTDMGVPNGAFPTTDGWVTLAALNDSRFARACTGLGVPELITDPRFATREDRRQNAEAIIEAFSKQTRTMTRADAISRLEENGVSCAEVRTVPEVAADPAFDYAFLEIPVDGGRIARTIGSPLRLSKTPVTLRSGIPALDEHGDEVRRELAEDAAASPVDGVPATRALDPT